MARKGAKRKHATEAAEAPAAHAIAAVESVEDADPDSAEAAPAKALKVEQPYRNKTKVLSLATRGIGALSPGAHLLPSPLQRAPAVPPRMISTHGSGRVRSNVLPLCRTQARARGT